MLFGEMLDNERKEGFAEGVAEARNKLLHLIELMQAGGDADKIFLLAKDRTLLQEMYKKYHIE